MDKAVTSIEIEYSWQDVKSVPCLVTSLPTEITGPNRVKIFIDIVSGKLGHQIAYGSLARGLDGSKLKYVLENGIDVNPTTSPIYADSILKAHEYGTHSNQIILLFKKDKLSRSWIEVPITISQPELQKLQLEYPTKLLFEGSDHYWLSRRKQTEPQVGSDYEAQYSFWCPGDPWNALACIIFNFSPTIDAALNAFSNSKKSQ